MILREGEDAGQVVLLGRHLLLGKVAHDVRTLLIDLGHDVEVEGIDVVVQSLVIEEELGQEAKILAVHTVVLAINLEDAEGTLAVDFPPRRTAMRAVPPVAAEGALPLHVLETVLADVEQLLVGILLRVGGEVPGLDLVPSQNDLGDVLHLGHLLVLPLEGGEGGVQVVGVGGEPA